ncbi:MAG: J domain-containing protein [Blautia sp.]|nr:J domain-containing protein [Blautia sp.]
MGSRGGQSNYHKSGGSRSRNSKRLYPSVIYRPKPKQKEMSEKEKRAQAKAERAKAKAERAAKRDQKLREQAARMRVGMSGIDDYAKRHGFSSRKEAAVHAAATLDNPERAEIFGILSAHYGNPYLAKKWYKEMSKLVHPDNNRGNSKARDAMSYISETYEGMIERYR